MIFLISVVGLISSLGLFQLMTLTLSLEKTVDLCLSFKLVNVSWFLFIVLLVSSAILIYSKFYMVYSSIYNKFLLLLASFVGSMLVLISSNSWVSLFWGWDILGLSSYFLVVLFLNVRSGNSGMVTVMSNRIGDFLMLGCIIAAMSLYFSGMTSKMLLLMGVLLFLLCLTKSAVFPFSIWLPQAMAAPTPISALVHSSTLVTAGVFVLISLIPLLSMKLLLILMMTLTMLTMLIAGSLSLMEVDFKKIIALSTLSQISLIGLSSSLMQKYLAYFHLLSHATFKSLLFMVVGFILHFNFGEQNLSLLKSSLNSPIGLSLLFISLAGLMGIFYSSGFYSKDTLIDNISLVNSSLTVNVMLYSLILITVVYSVRIILSISLLPLNLSFNSSNIQLNFAIVIGGLSVLVFSKTFLGHMLSMEVINLSLTNSKIFFVGLLMTLIIGSVLTNWSSKIWQITTMSFLHHITYSTFAVKSISLKLKHMVDMFWLEILSLSLLQKVKYWTTSLKLDKTIKISLIIFFMLSMLMY